MKNYSSYRDFHLDSTEELDILIDGLAKAGGRIRKAEDIPGLSDSQVQALQVARAMVLCAYREVAEALMIVDKGAAA